MRYFCKLFLCVALLFEWGADASSYIDIKGNKRVRESTNKGFISKKGFVLAGLIAAGFVCWRLRCEYSLDTTHFQEANSGRGAGGEHQSKALCLRLKDGTDSLPKDKKWFDLQPGDGCSCRSSSSSWSFKQAEDWSLLKAGFTKTLQETLGRERAQEIESLKTGVDAAIAEALKAQPRWERTLSTQDLRFKICILKVETGQVIVILSMMVETYFKSSEAEAPSPVLQFQEL